MAIDNLDYIILLPRVCLILNVHAHINRDINYYEVSNYNFLLIKYECFTLQEILSTLLETLSLYKNTGMFGHFHAKPVKVLMKRNFHLIFYCFAKKCC